MIRKLFELFIKLWKNIINFKGEEERKEFFLSLVAEVVFTSLLLIPLLFAAVIIFSFAVKDSGITMRELMNFEILLVVIYEIIVCLPFVSLLARRIRNSGVNPVACWLITLAIPLFGFILVGSMQKNDIRHCLVTKVGYVLIVAGFGSVLWPMMLGVFMDSDIFTTVGMVGLAAATAGIITGYIGTKIDESNQ